MRVKVKVERISQAIGLSNNEPVESSSQPKAFSAGAPMQIIRCDIRRKVIRDATKEPVRAPDQRRLEAMTFVVGAASRYWILSLEG